MLQAQRLKIALKKTVFNHTFATCQKLGQQNLDSELIFGVVATAIGYIVKVLILEHTTKCHAHGCGKSVVLAAIPAVEDAGDSFLKTIQDTTR